MQLTATTTVNLDLPETRDVFLVYASGAATIPTLNANMPIHPGRVVRLINAASSGGDLTFTNNSDSVTKGQMDLGADVAVGTEEVLELVQNDLGVWWQASETNAH